MGKYLKTYILNLSKLILAFAVLSVIIGLIFSFFTRGPEQPVIWLNNIFNTGIFVGLILTGTGVWKLYMPAMHTFNLLMSARIINRTKFARERHDPLVDRSTFAEHAAKDREENRAWGTETLFVGLGLVLFMGALQIVFYNLVGI